MQEKSKVALLSVISNLFLIIIKITVGIITGSISIISEAIHSLLDLIAALMAYLAVKASSMPPDREHPYGHSKIENISGFLESILIIVAAIWIIYESVKKLIYPQNIDVIGLGIMVMFISTAVNVYVSRKLYITANKTNSIALKADAAHLSTDIYTSAGVMVGLFLIWLLEKIFHPMHFHWIDPLSAIIIAFIIIRTGVRLTSESMKDLIDSSATEDEIIKIQNIIHGSSQVIGYRNLKTRKVGNKIFVEFELLIDKNLTFENAHSITEDISSRIKSEMNCEVIIHPEPFSK